MYKLKFKPLPKWQECREFLDWYYSGSGLLDAEVTVSSLYRCRNSHRISVLRLFYCNYSFFSGIHFENVEDLQIFLNNHEEGTFFYNPGQTEYQHDFEICLGAARISGGSCYPELDAFLDSFR